MLQAAFRPDTGGRNVFMPSGIKEIAHRSSRFECGVRAV
jgi:hypothetical protein